MVGASLAFETGAVDCVAVGAVVLGSSSGSLLAGWYVRRREFRLGRCFCCAIGEPSKVVWLGASRP